MSKKLAANVLILIVELRIPASQSLKDKRQVINSLKERLIGRFKISAAEVGALDKWQRAVIGASMISNDARYLESCAQKLVEFIHTEHRVEIISSKMEII